jgi:hypothetical protein
MPKQRNRPHHHPHDYNREDTIKWPIRFGRSFVYPKGYIPPKFMRGEKPYDLSTPPVWGILLFFVLVALIAVLVALLAMNGKL